MKYSVIKTGGKQYRVSEGDVIEIDKIGKKANEKIAFNDVLLIVNDDGLKIGKPVLEGEKVEATVLEEKRGEKIYVSKYKAKVRYRKRIGFRAELTKVKIDKISGTKTATKPKSKSK